VIAGRNHGLRVALFTHRLASHVLRKLKDFIMNAAPKDKADPKPDAEGGGGVAERRKREENDGSLVDETKGRDSGSPLPVPPPPD